MITEDKNEFVRIKDFVDVKVRIPNPDDDYLRPITYYWCPINTFNSLIISIISIDKPYY